jgi:hypothetical protein
MGANVSNQMIESTTSIVSNAMTEIATTVNSSTSSYTASTQEMPVRITGLRATNSSLTFNQKADIAVTTMLESSNELSNDLTNKLKATLKETMVNDLKQANEGLNLGQLNISNAEQRTRTYIENNVENIIKTSINNSVRGETVGKQYMPVDLENVILKGSSIVFNQEMQIKAIAKNVSTSIVTNVIKNALTSDVTKDLTNKTEQLNKGMDIFTIIAVLFVVALGGIGYKAVQGKEKEMKMQMFRNGQGSKRRGNISGPRGAQGPSRKYSYNEKNDLSESDIDAIRTRPRRGGTGNFNVLGGDDDYSGGDYYGGVLSDAEAAEAARKAKGKKKKLASTKKWYAIGGVIALILIFAVWYYGKQWVADKYDISYLGDLEPEGGRSGFYAPSMVYSIPQYKYV